MGGMGPSYYDDDDDYDDEYGFDDDVEEAEVRKGLPGHVTLFRCCKWWLYLLLLRCLHSVCIAFINSKIAFSCRLLRNSWN